MGGIILPNFRAYSVTKITKTTLVYDKTRITGTEEKKTKIATEVTSTEVWLPSMYKVQSHLK